MPMLLFMSSASYSACYYDGGHTKVIERRAGIIYRHMLVALGASLARELAKRVFAYVRGARLAGRLIPFRPF